MSNPVGPSWTDFISEKQSLPDDLQFRPCLFILNCFEGDENGTVRPKAPRAIEKGPHEEIVWVDRDLKPLVAN